MRSAGFLPPRLAICLFASKFYRETLNLPLVDLGKSATCIPILHGTIPAVDVLDEGGVT